MQFTIAELVAAMVLLEFNRQVVVLIALFQTIMGGGYQVY